MHLEAIRDYALSFDEVEESTPFGPNVAVYKVNHRIFLLLPLDTADTQFNVKCNPEKAIQLREEYPYAVLPGYHMNKKHWNTVIVNGDLTTTQLQSFISDSYALVKGKTRKK
ncbi:MAG: hypothetical protein RIQ62_81 [Bacteroidota bacterium]|jgi:predicted DNA-binding protein (MmcQ/YjbR family)